MENIILSTDSLEIGYIKKQKKETVAKNITIHFKKATLIALVGKNGAGKSTLLKTLIGTVKPLAGEVKLNKKNITQYSKLQLAQYVSIVLTEKLPPSNLTVYELIALGRQPYTNWLGKLNSNDKKKIEEAIEVTKVIPLIEKNHNEISDGQLQKVLIARALAQDTDIIILDEPTTHLDLPNKIALFELLKNLAHKKNKCIVLSTHDIEIAIKFCDELLVLNNNTVEQLQTTKLSESTSLSNLFKEDGINFDHLSMTFLL